jgi:hypothetical protein
MYYVYWSQKIKKNEIGGVCRTIGEGLGKKYLGYKNFSWKRMFWKLRVRWENKSKRILKRNCLTMWPEFIWFRLGPIVGLYGNRNEISVSRTGREIIFRRATVGFSRRTLILKVGFGDFRCTTD